MNGKTMSDAGSLRACIHNSGVRRKSVAATKPADRPDESIPLAAKAIVPAATAIATTATGFIRRPKAREVGVVKSVRAGVEAAALRQPDGSTGCASNDGRTESRRKSNSTSALTAFELPSEWPAAFGIWDGRI